ncbi:hypothetical protein [Crocosphaera sp.]|uniref:hypothetical protein n=1 Tax=Crocosphaera sp. TaxID=2729996 RepID=UPI002603E857|nr:hypothetical protein [Crocosphaera sp.]MDJ0578715.1 hypothetical protein [Crocosphaera sp.]
MNTRYTEIFLFLSRLSRRNNKGFVSGFALVAGVLMTLTGAVMLVRSSSEKEKVTVQQNIAKGMAKAEVGVIRIAQFLNQEQHQELIKTKLEDWPTVATQIVNKYQPSGDGNNNNNNNGGGHELEAKACDGTQIPGEWGLGGGNSDTYEPIAPFDKDEFNDMVDKLRNKQWIEVDDQDSSAGEFRLTSYELLPDTTAPNIVKLEIEARGLDQDNSSSDLKFNNSIRKISVNLPILERSDNSSNATGTENTALTPGLWVSDTNNGSGGNNDNSKQSSDSSKPNKPINAVTWIDCSQNGDWNTSESYVNSNKLDSTAIAIGETNVNPTENGGVQQVRDNLPDIPEVPSGVSNLDPLNFSNCGITLPRGVSGNTSSGSSSEQCDDFQNNATDTAIGNIYYYHFKGDDSIILSNAQIRINPPVGKKVVIFIDGGITMSGTSTFDNAQTTQCRSESGNQTVVTFIGDPEDPSKLELYSRSSSKEINISGGTIISGFVHAPQTKLLISQAQIRGAAWVKVMDASNSGSDCDRSIKQMDVGSTLVMGDSGSQRGRPQNFTVVGQVSSYRSIEVD